MSSENYPMNGKEPGQAVSTAPPPAHQGCSGCSDSSHILYPLADLLKAVASSLQSQTGHKPEPAESSPSEPKQSQSEVPPETHNHWFSETLDRNHEGRPTGFLPQWGQVPTANSVPIESSIPTTPPPMSQETPFVPQLPQAAVNVVPLHSAYPEPVDSEENDFSEPETSLEPFQNDEECEDEEEVSADADNDVVETAPEESLSDECLAATDIATDEPSVDQAITATLPASDPPKLRSPLLALLDSKRKEKEQEQKKQTSQSDDDDEEWDSVRSEPKPARFPQFKGVDGIAVMLFGVILPAFIFAGGCAAVPKRITLVLLDHPIETIVELMLVALIPLTNFVMWTALRKNDVRFSLKRGVALGSSMVTSIAIAGIAIAALSYSNQTLLETEIGTTFETGFTWLAVMALAAAACSGYIMYSFQKTRDFAKSKQLIFRYSLTGMALTSLTLFGAEAKNWHVRIAERLAVSTNKQERKDGLDRLRPVFSERSLRMECTDSRAAGLCGLFFPIKDTPQQELYFRLTGKPFSFKDEHNDIAAMPDDYVARHAVGDKVSGLALVRSEMSAAVQPKTLTSAVDWTFVLGNESYYTTEARTEISVPPGGVITGMTEWVNGQQVHGRFDAGKNQQDTSWNSGSTSAAITDLGHGRALLRCSGVPAGAQLKMAVKMVVPLKPESLKSKEGTETASLVLPKLIASNYSVEDENAVQLYSSMPINSDFTELHKSASNGLHRLGGTLEGKRLDSAEVLVTVNRPAPQALTVLDKLAVQMKAEDEKRLAEQRRANHGQYAPLPQQLTVIVDGRQGIQSQLDQLAANLNHHRDANGLKPQVKTVKPEYITQTVSRVKNPAPKHLVIVVDGSEAMKGHVQELKQALTSQAIPVENVDLMIASQDNPKLAHKVPLAEGIKLLDEKNFGAGQNNLKTVIDAAEEAGSARGGAVLWIHGPQPVSSGEIYITTPYAAHPSLYELPIANGDIDTATFFKNHNDIGQFMQVSHKSSLDKDVACFFAKWQPNNVDYVVAMNSAEAKPAKTVELTEAEARGVLQLNAYNKCMQLLAQHKDGAAARIAVAYGVLTPVSSVVIDEAAQQSSLAQNSNSDQIQVAAAPQLQGATNGTIGPQGTDATYIVGVNTAGTVRVNNLANLEALLNIIANGMEILGLAWGGVTVISGFVQMASGIDATRKIIFGAVGMTGGMAVPGMINWLVASARDANLFS